MWFSNVCLAVALHLTMLAFYPYKQSDSENGISSTVSAYLCLLWWKYVHLNQESLYTTLTVSVLI